MNQTSKKPKSFLEKLAKGRRGMALLMVLVTIAVLSAIVVDFVYQTRVNVDIAANVRDRIKAYYLARSAVNFSRLILHFQGQVDRLTGGTVKLYDIIPLQSNLAQALTSGPLAKSFGLEGANLGDLRGFGNFDGNFSAEIEDEYQKVNLNALDSLPSICAPVVAEILALIGAPRYQSMFEQPDADGQYNTPADVVAAIHDWIDADNSFDNFNPDLVVADPFSQASVFQPGTSGEDSRYDMLAEPYQNKNDPLFSVDELFMVRGIGDDFMAEFGDKFTVFTDPSLLLNLSSVNDPVIMLSVLCMQPENLALCTEAGLPQLLEALAMFFELRTIMQLTPPFAVPSNQNIQDIFKGLGPTLNQYFMKNLAPFSDTFSVKAVGEVAEVVVTIRTVLKNTVSGQEILYWQVM